MATESSPYSEEQQIEESLTEELLALLALSLAFSTDKIVLSKFEPAGDYNQAQQRFRNKMSEVLPDLNQTSRISIEIALARAARDLGLNDLSVDYSNPIFREFVADVFEKHIELVSQTNRNMFNELRQIAFEEGWSNQELARRFKQYFGLTPNHLRTVLNMERALLEDDVKKTVRGKLLQKRIDQLIEWRLNLIAVQMSTEIVEGSKDLAFTYLVTTGQVSVTEYEKEWLAVPDERTTAICLSSHRSRADIGQRFANGLYHPPAYPPYHPCRSSIRLVKKII